MPPGLLMKNELLQRLRYTGVRENNNSLSARALVQGSDSGHFIFGAQADADTLV